MSTEADVAIGRCRSDPSTPFDYQASVRARTNFASFEKRNERERNGTRLPTQRRNDNLNATDRWS